VLDKFQSARADGTLATSSDFQDSMDEIDGDAVAKLYVNGAALQAAGPLPIAIQRFALAVRAEGEGVRVDGGAQLAENWSGFGSEPFKAELPNEVPAGALVYLDFNDLGSALKQFRDAFAQANPAIDGDLARLEHELGVSLDEDVFPLFAGETALYVRPGLFVPEVTLVTQVDDEQAALSTAGKLVEALRIYGLDTQSPRITTIDGVQATELPLAVPVSLYYAAFDGHLVVTTSRDGIAELRNDDDRLADDPDFKRALDEAGVPDETTGFGYVDLQAALGYVLGFMGGEGASPQVRANLEPLDHLVFYGTKDGRTVRFAGFLAVD
jgi:hypothetical protein